MLWREIGYLCSEKETLDSLGKPFKTFEKKEVFCNERALSETNFTRHKPRATAQSFA